MPVIQMTMRGSGTPLSANAFPTYVTGFGSSGLIYTDAATCSTAGGDGSAITYNWRRISGSTLLTPTTPTAATTTFQGFLATPGEIASASFVCDATQSGATTTSNAVAAEIEKS